MSDLENVAAPDAVATDTAVSTPETPAQETDNDLHAALSEAYDRATREGPDRGPDGKFVSKEPKDPEAVEEASDDAAPVEAEAEDQTSPEAETVEPETPAIDPPASWSREVREKWASIPPEVQSYIAQRETEAHGQISRLGQQVKAFEPIAKTLEQYKGTFERSGLDYSRGVAALLEVQSMLDVNPRAAIHQIAHAYGVDLGAEPSPSDAVPSGQVLSLQAKVAELERQIAETRTDVVSAKERDRMAREAALQSEIEAFAKANPYFTDVEADIAALIPVLRAQSPGLSERQLLEAAYTKATRINDGVFAKIEADRKAKEAAEAKKKAEAAKKAASLNVRTTTTARPAERDLRDELSQVYDRMQSRAS